MFGPKCKRKGQFTSDVGSCSNCHGDTSSSAHKLCKGCSENGRKLRCEHCARQLKGYCRKCFRKFRNKGNYCPCKKRNKPEPVICPM